MDMTDKSSGRFRGRKRKKGDITELAAQLAPLEELNTSGAATAVASSSHIGDHPVDPHYGAIVVDSEGLNLPKDIMEGSGGKTVLGMEPVVIVILAVMLSFIAFIAWQISLMPAE
jgi:hypothetical protein